MFFFVVLSVVCFCFSVEASDAPWREPDLLPPVIVVDEIPPVENTIDDVDVGVEEKSVAPKIAIVIDDMGLKKKLSRQFMTLPAPLTLSFLPFASEMPQQIALAKRSGHAVMLHVPMEPLRYIDEPMMLRVSANDRELTQAIKVVLDAVSDYDGVNNHMGSRFTADERGMAFFLDAVGKKGLFFLDSRTGKRSVGGAVAAHRGVPYIARDVFIDNSRTAEALARQFELLEEKAIENGAAVGIGHPHTETLDALSRWIPDAKARGFEFVTVKSLVSD